MSEQTFGAWLLGQQERTDSIGSMARSWKQLKEARGYKHSQEKSVRELLSSMFGEDWANMQGDEVMNAAVAEWRGDFEQPAGDAQGTIFDLPGGFAPADDTALRIPGYPGMDSSPIVPNLPDAVQITPGKVILVINGMDVELPPGRYTLAIVVQPAEIEAQEFADAVAEAVTSVYPLSPAGVDWNALFRGADLSAVPEE